MLIALFDTSSVAILWSVIYLCGKKMKHITEWGYNFLLETVHPTRSSCVFFLIHVSLSGEKFKGSCLKQGKLRGGEECLETFLSCCLTPVGAIPIPAATLWRPSEGQSNCMRLPQPSEVLLRPCGDQKSSLLVFSQSDGFQLPEGSEGLLRGRETTCGFPGSQNTL